MPISECMLILTLFIALVYGEEIGFSNPQLLTEIQRQIDSGLNSYESISDRRIEVVGRRHGEFFTRAQEACRGELLAAERIENAYRTDGHQWSASQREAASQRIANHLNSAQQLQTSAMKLRGQIYNIFNDPAKPAFYNPQRFTRLTKIKGLQWLAGEKINLQINNFIPEGW